MSKNNFETMHLEELIEDFYKESDESKLIQIQDEIVNKVKKQLDEYIYKNRKKITKRAVHVFEIKDRRLDVNYLFDEKYEQLLFLIFDILDKASEEIKNSNIISDLDNLHFTELEHKVRDEIFKEIEITT